MPVPPMDVATKALADQADMAFNEHFDGCEQCKRAFSSGRAFGGLCEAGGLLNRHALEIHDRWAIEHLNEAECRQELKLASEGPHPDKKVENWIRELLLDRLRKLMCPRCA